MDDDERSAYRLPPAGRRYFVRTALESPHSSGGVWLRPIVSDCGLRADRSPELPCEPAPSSASRCACSPLPPSHTPRPADPSRGLARAHRRAGGGRRRGGRGRRRVPGRVAPPRRQRHRRVPRGQHHEGAGHDRAVPAGRRPGRCRWTPRFSSSTSSTASSTGRPTPWRSVTTPTPTSTRRSAANVSYRDLCEAMITVSSNLATNVLIERLGVDAIRQTVAALRRRRHERAARRRGQQGLPGGRRATPPPRAGWRRCCWRSAAGTAVSAAGQRRDAGDPEAAEVQRRHPGRPARGHRRRPQDREHHEDPPRRAPSSTARRPYVLVVLTRGVEDQKKSAALIADITREIHAWAGR